MPDESVDKARERFRKQNMEAVARTRRGIEKVREQAMGTYSVNLKNRQKNLQVVSENLDRTVKEIRLRHETVRAKLNQEAVTRDVHVRVNRSLEALEDFVRVQRDVGITEDRIMAALEDPAISGSLAERRKRASVSDLIQSAQKQLIQQTEFINIAAHELRTPIMPILVNAEILEAQYEGHSDEIDAIKRNALRLQHLAENILNVARIDSNSLGLRKEVFDLNSILAQIVRDKVGSKRVPIVPQLCEGKLMIDADRSRIEQVVSNLLDNALKFTVDGQVTVTSRSEGGKAIVALSDSGSGIAPEIFPLLFTKFSAKSQGGTGLGLFICRGIVEMHGGSITGRNNEGSSGATFEFNIPLAGRESNPPDEGRTQAALLKDLGLPEGFY
jgi:signal transduction histidine kinase